MVYNLGHANREVEGMEYSPALAIATALFEITVALWAFVGSGEKFIIRTTSLILVLLAGYQLTEVGICANTAAAGFLPRLAFIIVTWLPPLGLLLIAGLHRPRSRLMDGTATTMLAAALAIVAWIAIDRSFVHASVCSAVFARYTSIMPRFMVYSGFYWAGLLGMILFSGYGARTCVDQHRRRMLRYVFMGTLAFVLPSLAVSWYVPPTEGALPSIMCHFALLLAISLTRMIYVERKETEEQDTSPATQPG
jgi:hypothetical protein